ncbi:GAP family protein [Micromonospora sp. NBC_00858]|uniref:GAP family protein n=1 Tax=Micromonospora sp. NBC_00858 TaxID=2975979 RepID=UPI00386CC1CA|nr:GAP family protein [Micromonospora sp. NBC_00858]
MTVDEEGAGAVSIVTVGAVFGLALLDMLSPALIGVTVYLLLARPRRLGLLLGLYLGTIAVAYLALGVLLMLGLGAILPAIDPSIWAWIQGGIGIALFAGSWFIPAKKRPDVEPAPVKTPTPRSMVLVGLGTWLFEFYTAVPYFGAIGIMTSAGLEPAQWLLLLGVYVIIMILPGIALYLAWLLLRGRMQERLERWQRKIAGGSRTAMSWIVGIAGVLIFLDALPNEIAITIP